MVNAYNHFVNAFDLSWKKPIYKRSERLPTVPSTEQVNMIIAHAGRKYALIFSFLRDTGLRPIELHRLTLRNLDLEKGLVYPVTAKSGSARVLRLKASTLSMLKEYVSRSEFRLDERMFPSTDVVSHVFMRVRNRLSNDCMNQNCGESDSMTSDTISLLVFTRRRRTSCLSSDS